MAIRAKKIISAVWPAMAFLLLPAGRAFAGFTNNFATVTLNNNAEIRFSSVTNNAGGTLNGGSSKINVLGNWANSGVFNAGTSTVAFENSADSSTITGNTAFYSLVSGAAGKTIIFEAGSAQSVANVFSIVGVPGNLVKLRSSADAVKWSISSPNGPQAVSFADIKDSDALLNNVVAANSYNSGNNNAKWIFSGMPADCGTGFLVKKDGTANYTSIQAALNALPTTLSTNTCIVIRDAGNYPEQVTVQGFANNGYRLKIMADPAAGSAPVVDPPGASSAAFLIKNDSVTVQGINIIPSNTAPYGILVSSASVNISGVTVLSGGMISNAGISLAANSSGAINISSNTVHGAPYGLKIAAQAAGTSIIIASNTIIPAISASYDTYGIYLNGLASGATIYNNNIYYRIPGAATGRKVYGLYGQTVTGLNFDHNRINNPGMVTGGDFVAASFTDSAQVYFKFNDVASTNTAAFTLFELTNSGLIIKNNIFLASATAGSWLTSDGGPGSLSSDYNDWDGVESSLGWSFNGGPYASLAAFSGASGQDINSIQADPEWYAATAGAEDFHPLAAEGRWLGGAWIDDAETSPTLNSGDPGEPYADEPLPNGLRVNLGSYGNTAQASRANPPGAACGIGAYCAMQCDVNQSASKFQSIQSALNALNHNLTSETCVVIRDAANYAEQVLVQGFTNNNYRLKIMADPALITAPSVSPPAASAAAFLIKNASVTVQGIDIMPASGVAYGIAASSASVTVSSVNVISGGWISGAGIQLSSYSAVSYSTITVQAADGLRLSGLNSEVSFSAIAGGGAGKYALYLADAGFNTVTRSRITNSAGGGAYLAYSAEHNTISYSTITGSAGGNAALGISGSSNTVAESYMQGASAADISGSTGTVIGGSVFAAVSSAGSALRFAGGGLNLALSSSTFTGGAQGAAIYLDAHNSGAINLSSNTIAGGQYGLNIAAQDPGTELSVSSLTFRSLTPGATAINFLGGQFVSTFTALAFNSRDISVNVNAVSLGAGSRITMSRAVGAKVGAFYENDPSGYVQWDPLPAGCGSGLNVTKDGTGNFLSIQEAVNAVPASLSANTCVIIRDTETYSEQVSVRGIAGNGYRLKIMANPSFVSSAPVVNPPEGSAAAFLLLNDSVTVQGLNIISTNTVTYGIFASSAAVNISSVNVLSGGNISGAGIQISSRSAVWYSSITVQTADGLRLTGAGSEVSFSTVTAGAAGKYALYIAESDSNTVTRSYIANSAGGGARLAPGADNNTLSYSTITSAGGYALEITGNYANTAAGCYVRGSTAAYISGSTGTIAGGNIFVAADAAGAALRLAGGSLNTTVSSNTFTGGAQGAGIYLDAGNAGRIELSSNTVTGGLYGLNIAAQKAGAELKVSSLTFSSLTEGGTAVNFLGGQFVLTLTAVAFNNANIGVNVSAGPLEAGSRITMSLPAGPKAGVLYENDPSGYIDWGALPGDCGAGLNVARNGTGNYRSIQAAVSAVPVNLSTTTCIVIRDTETYSEQITVRGFANHGYRLLIMADPTFVSSAPAINPPAGSGAAFRLLNDSVTVQGINIISTNTVAYGILASSASVTISSVNIISGEMISGAGISVSSRSLVAYSSITVQAAHGLQLTGSNSEVLFSTMTSKAAGYAGLYITGGSAGALYKSYIEGSTAAYISGSDGIVLQESVFVSNDTAGHALRLADGSADLKLSSSTLTGGAQGAGIYLDAGNSGALELSSNTITGGRYGLNIAAQSAGAALSVAGLTFSSLTAGATAINFLGGEFVSTFTAVAFNSAGIGTNINASALAEGSSVYILLPSGQKAAQALADDPLNRVQWPWPAAPYLYAVNESSIAVAYGANGASGYTAEAAVAPDFAGALSSSTLSQSASPLSVSILSPDTTYYLRAGALWDQATYYNPVVVFATSTLALPPAAPVVLAVQPNSAVASWGAVAAQGYLLEASTASAFTGIVLSSSSSGLQVSTLTVGGLLQNTTYYFRAGSLNWNKVLTYAVAAPTSTLSDPVTGAQIAGVFMSSVAVSWLPLPVSPSSATCEGYMLEASTDPYFGGLIFSTATADSQTADLALTGMVSNILYYFRAGTLNWNGVPNYALAVSTETPDITPPDISTGAAAYQSGSPDGIRLFWTAPGDNGYLGPLTPGSEFRVQWSTSAPEAVDWSTAAAQVIITTGPVEQGLTVSTAIFGPPSGRTAYFRVWAADEKSQWSVMSATFAAFVSPFSFETVDGASADVGVQASLAAGRDGSLQVSYGDLTAKTLKYAKWNGAWNISTIASDGESEGHSSLALDGGGEPQISYLKGSPYDDLGYARWDGVDWSTQTVDAPGLTGYDTSIKVDGLGNPHISYTDFSTAKLRYAEWDGSAWSAGDVADVGNADSASTSLDLAADGSPHIAYNNSTTASLMYAKKTGASWSVSAVDAARDGDRNISLVLDSSANAHLAYISPAGALKYAEWAGSWQKTEIETEIDAAQPSIALDGAGRPHISYYDQALKILKYARYDGVIWSTGTVDSAGDEGSNGSIALDGAGDIHIVYRDGTTGDLKAAHWTGAGLPAPLGGNARGRAQAPDGMQTGLLGSASVQWLWTDHAANEEGYAVYYSSTGIVPYVFSSSVSAAASTGGTGFWFQTGLTPNTSYQAYAAAYNEGGVAVSSPALVYTLAEAPASLEAAKIYISSVVAAWPPGANPAGTNYLAELSSKAVFTPSDSYGTTGSSAPFGGLAANTTYYFRVRAYNSPGVETAPTGPLAAVTLPDPPSALGFSGVSYSSLTVSWAGGLNSPETRYYAQVGFDPGFTSGASTITYAFSHTFGELSPNTTYFVRVKAIGLLGAETVYAQFGSTITTSVTPIATLPCAVSTNTVTGYWSYNGNPPGTRYLAQISTDNFNTVQASSETVNDYALFGGLTPNTTYYLRTASLNIFDTPSQFAGLPEALTYAAQPLKQADPFPSVSAFSVAVEWLANFNPPETEYLSEVSTAADFSAAKVIGPGWAAGVLVTAVVPDPLTLYYFRAKARNAAGIETAYENFGSTRTIGGVDSSPPVITDNQSGDMNWRSSNTAVYNIDFADSGGSYLNQVKVKITAGAGQSGTLIADWTPVLTNIAANSYLTDWSLTPGLWSLLPSGLSYVSVRAFDGSGNYSDKTDAFYVLKDTTAPTIADNQPGEEVWRNTNPGAVYLVNFNDAQGGAGLAAVEYSASDTEGAADGKVLTWTGLTGLTPGATYYNGPWALNFGGLENSVTNYISVRARDLAGNVSSLADAFLVLKNVSGPTVRITAPYAGFHSALAAITGNAAPMLEADVSGTEITIQEKPSNKYWDGVDFTTADRVWLTAAGQTAWTYDSSGVGWVSGTRYEVVARSSDTALNYSITYATAAFTFDRSVPTAFISAPAADTTPETPAVIAGTAQDPSPNSGVPYINLTLQRQVDLKWWNFFAGAWGASPVSTMTAGGASWSFYPDGALRGNLLDGGVYFVYASARDGAMPPNESPAGLYASTFTVRDTVPPGVITEVSGAEGKLPGRLLLTWTASGDDGPSAALSQGEFRINYSTWAGAVFSTAAAQVLISTTVTPGTTQAYLISGLAPGVTYYLAVWAGDEAGLWSGLSPLASARAGVSLPDTISGNVRTPTGQGVTGVMMQAINQALAVVKTAYTIDDGSGAFTLNGLDQGVYRVQATWLDNGFASSVASDQIPTGYAEVAFELSVAYQLASIGGELAGYQMPAAGSKPQAAGYRLLGAASVELYQSNSLVASAPVDAGGRFLISNLLPGSYMLKVPDGAGGSKQLQVTLAPGQDLRLSPLGELLKTDKVYAFPNPAGRSVTFHIESGQSPVLKQVTVFDITGRAIKEFPDTDFVEISPKVWEAVWNIPSGVASGVYIYSTRVKFVASGEHKKTIKKFAIIK